MSERTDAHAVAITGVYGTGKTSLVEELAAILEGRGERYAALDLDWLGWFDAGGGDHAAGRPVMLKNVDAVVGNYYDAGVRRFALAGSVASTQDLDDLRRALGMRVTVVRLTLPFAEIERRLAPSVTAGRADDLRVAKEWLAQGRGDDIGDLVIENDRPIRDVALETVAALGW